MDTIPYIFPYVAFYGTVRLIRSYSYTCNSNTNSLDTLPIMSPYLYLVDTGDSHYTYSFLIPPNSEYHAVDFLIQGRTPELQQPGDG